MLTGCVHPRVRHAPDPDVPVSCKRPAKERGVSKAAAAAAPVMLKVVYRMPGEDRAFVRNYGQEAVGTALEARNPTGSWAPPL